MLSLLIESSQESLLAKGSISTSKLEIAYPLAASDKAIIDTVAITINLRAYLFAAFRPGYIPTRLARTLNASRKQANLVELKSCTASQALRNATKKRHRKLLAPHATCPWHRCRILQRRRQTPRWPHLQVSEHPHPWPSIPASAVTCSIPRFMRP